MLVAILELRECVQQRVPVSFLIHEMIRIQLYFGKEDLKFVVGKFKSSKTVMIRTLVLLFH